MFDSIDPVSEFSGMASVRQDLQTVDWQAEKEERENLIKKYEDERKINLYLFSEIDKLKKAISEERQNNQRVVIVKQVSEKDAEKQIIDYLKFNKKARISELQEKLGIDYLQILGIIEKLENQKKLREIHE